MRFRKCAALLVLALAASLAHAATHDWSDWETITERRCVCRVYTGSTGPLCGKKCTWTWERRTCPGDAEVSAHPPHAEGRNRRLVGCEGTCEN